MTRNRFTVYRSARPGRRLEWHVLDELRCYSIAICQSRRDAQRVASALNSTVAA